MSARDRLPRIAALAGTAFAGLSAYSWYAARRFEDLDPQSADAPGSFLDAAGVRVHYVEAGRGEPVLLVHGLNASTFSFRHTIPELAQSYHVVAVDRIGSGYSARPPDADYSLTAQAALLARVMDGLDIARAAVVGHSLGGAVAMRMALDFPERVSRLALVDSATDHELRLGSRSATYLRHLLPLAALLALHRAWFRRFAMRSAVHDPAHLTPEVLDGYARTSRMKGHLRALGLLMAHRRRDEPLALERIHQPALILWGEHDRWLPPSRGEELARRIPDAKLFMVRSAGHLALEEQPDLCNRALLDFLASPSAPEALTETQPAEKAETPG